MHAYLFVSSGMVPVNLTVTRDQPAGFNAYVAAGSPSYPCAVTVTINDGVLIGDSGILGYAFDTGAWPNGSTFLLVNNCGALGGIEGYGGDGGDAPGGYGGDGGAAIIMRMPISIRNGNGFIRAGGGGGSAGTSVPYWLGAGGGGGGRGNPGGRGGFRDTNGLISFPGGDGSYGSRNGYGVGGFGGVADTMYGQRGGNGGDWGSYGLPSDFDSSGQRTNNPGAGGIAIIRNGYSITWLDGYNDYQVMPWPVT